MIETAQMVSLGQWKAEDPWFESSIFSRHLLGPILILRNKCWGVYSVKYGTCICCSVFLMFCLQQCLKVTLVSLLLSLLSYVFLNAFLFSHPLLFLWCLLHYQLAPSNQTTISMNIPTHSTNQPPHLVSNWQFMIVLLCV